jgi:hypothetical protein
MAIRSCGSNARPLGRYGRIWSIGRALWCKNSGSAIGFSVVDAWEVGHADDAETCAFCRRESTPNSFYFSASVGYATLDNGQTCAATVTRKLFHAAVLSNSWSRN